MRRVHHVQPIVAHRLERRDALAHAVHENLPAAARNRAKAGLDELADDFLQRQLEHFAEMDEFRRAEAVDVDPREFAFDMRQQIEIPRQGELRMMAALQQNLRAAQRAGFLNLPVQLGQRNDVGVGGVLGRGKTRKTCSRHCRRWCS